MSLLERSKYRTLEKLYFVCKHVRYEPSYRTWLQRAFGIQHRLWTKLIDEKILIECGKVKNNNYGYSVGYTYNEESKFMEKIERKLGGMLKNV